MDTQRDQGAILPETFGTFSACTSTGAATSTTSLRSRVFLDLIVLYVHTMPLKQAVLLIHGIGEQRPMDTLRSFVETVWETDTSIHHKHAILGTFSKPDEISGSYELRRLTTTQNKVGVRTDFFEFYWAHMMEGNRMTHVLSWLWRLLKRRPRDVPKPLLWPWIGLVSMALFSLGMILLSIFFAIESVNEIPTRVDVKKYYQVISGILGLGIIPVLSGIIANYVGDAARYLDPSPKNIGRRQAVRAKGIDILKKIHATGEYGRIIVVGHSLGSFIAYDILTHAWPDFNPGFGSRKKIPHLRAMDTLLKEDTWDLAAFKEKQQALFQEQAKQGTTWRVTDLVTLGSPLSYADILLAKDKAELHKKQEQKELPMCPPIMEGNGDKRSIFYTNNGTRRLHHAALFAITRWSNIYFPHGRIFKGDMLSGPIAPLFGKGIDDRKALAKQKGRAFKHTAYWKQKEERKEGEVEEHVKVLREVLGLGEKVMVAENAK